MPRITSTLAFATFLAALAYVSASAQEAPATPPYGAQLEGFDHPYPVQRFGFTSQGEGLSMAYMDVAPKVAGNGRTVVLLHWQELARSRVERTIAVLSEAGYRMSSRWIRSASAPHQAGARHQFSFNQSSLPTRARC